MRILVIQESDWMKRGPHHSHHLMERLSKKGHNVRVIDYEIQWKEGGKKGLISKRQVFDNVHKAINDGAVTVIRPPIIKIPVLDYVSLTYTHYKEIQRQFKEFKPDIVIGFGILNTYIAFQLAKKSDIPFVYYVMDELHRLVPEKAFRDLAKYIEIQNIKDANKVISINEGLREYTMQMGSPKERTEVIRAGVNLDQFNLIDQKAIREKHGIDDESTILFFMGWLYNFSGLKEVALELAKSERHDIKLLIIGKGDLWDTLQHIKSKYKLGNRMILIDWVPYEEVPKYLAASDVCILPAYQNDIMKNIVPIKIYEYMAAGKPVIATALYGIMKEFSHNNGITYIDQPANILKAVSRMTKEDLIREGLKARAFVEMNSWEKIVNDFENLLMGIQEY